jgi:hypothetical protein
VAFKSAHQAGGFGSLKINTKYLYELGVRRLSLVNRFFNLRGALFARALNLSAIARRKPPDV